MSGRLGSAQPAFFETMKMKEAIPSISTGSITTVMASINGVGIVETVILAFLGGVAGYLGKIAIVWVIQSIKKTIKK